jgi:hypothetical protein
MAGEDACKRLADVIEDRLQAKNYQVKYKYYPETGDCTVWFWSRDEVELANKRHLGFADAESFVEYNVKDDAVTKFGLHRVLSDDVEVFDIDLIIPVSMHVNFDNKLVQIHEEPVVPPRKVPPEAIMRLLYDVYYNEEQYQEYLREWELPDEEEE